MPKEQGRTRDAGAPASQENELLTDAEYAQVPMQLEAVIEIVGVMDLDGFITRINRTEALAPINRIDGKVAPVEYPHQAGGSERFLEA